MSWISVDERLPEIRGDGTSRIVLIARPLRSRPRRLISSIGYLMKDHPEHTPRWHDPTRRPSLSVITDVKFWQPMPDPPDLPKPLDNDAEKEKAA